VFKNFSVMIFIVSDEGLTATTWLTQWTRVIKTSNSKLPAQPASIGTTLMLIVVTTHMNHLSLIQDLFDLIAAVFSSLVATLIEGLSSCANTIHQYLKSVDPLIIINSISIFMIIGILIFLIVEVREGFARTDERFDRIERIHETKLVTGLTVSVSGESEDSVVGKGMVIEIQGDYFLLTAAHVLLVLEGTCHLKWEYGNTCVRASLSVFYITMKYVQDGTRDVGLGKLALGLSGDPFSSMEIQDVIVSAPTAAQKVTGSSAFLRDGRTLEVIAAYRCLSSMRSKPGLSGSPLVSEENHLVGCLHGSSKDRARLHNDQAESAYSHSVYFDALSGVELVKVPSNEIHAILKEAEDLPASANIIDLGTSGAEGSTWLGNLLDMMRGSFKTPDTEDECESFASLGNLLDMKGHYECQQVENQIYDLFCRQVTKNKTPTICMPDTVRCVVSRGKGSS